MAHRAREHSHPMGLAHRTRAAGCLEVPTCSCFSIRSALMCVCTCRSAAGVSTDVLRLAEVRVEGTA